MILIKVTIIIALIIINGFFALSEIALLSVKRSRLKILVKQGNKKAEKALTLIRRSPEMLSTIQIAITAIGIFAGALGGATLAGYLEGWFSVYEPIAAYSKVISITLVVTFITYFSLVIGELVPKQMALVNPEKFSLRVAGTITLLMKIVMPFVKLLSTSTKTVLKLLHIKPAQEQAVTEDEIKTLIAEGVESGSFEKTEQKIVENIFHLGNQPIKDFITPNKEIDWVNSDDSIGVIKNIINKSDSTVLPVYKNSIQHAVGAIEINDVLDYILSSGVDNFNLETIIQPALYIDANLPSLVAIDRLRKSAIKIAIVEDKKTNKVLGIISFQDILEAIIGEFQIKQQ